MTATLDDFRWLISPAARVWLQRAAEAPQAGRGLAVLTSQLRRDLSAEQAHLVLQQAELRRRAQRKFSAAAEMFFTPVGLEQSTGEAVARYKAGRFPPGRELFDLCCGIGGDLAALAERGRVRGVDRDEPTALLAAANCRALGSPDVTVDVADAAGWTPGDGRPADGAAMHIDPDRRPTGRRTTDSLLCEPDARKIARLLDRCDAAAVKLAPAAPPPAEWDAELQWEWISHDGECKQLVAWSGHAARAPGSRTATVLSPAGRPLRTLHSPADAVGACGPQIASSIGRYVYEPDPAVLAAGLADNLAQQQQLARIQSGVAYLTGDRCVVDPALRGFEVSDVLPLDTKRLKALLRRRRIGRLEVKKRGVDLDPHQLRRKLRVPGEEAAVLIVAPAPAGVTAIVAARCDHP